VRPLLSREQVRHEKACSEALEKLLNNGATICRTQEPAFIDIIGIQKDEGIFFVEVKAGGSIRYSFNEKRFHELCKRYGLKLMLYHKNQFP